MYISIMLIDFIESLLCISINMYNKIKGRRCFLFFSVNPHLWICYDGSIIIKLASRSYLFKFKKY